MVVLMIFKVVFSPNFCIFQFLHIWCGLVFWTFFEVCKSLRFHHHVKRSPSQTYHYCFEAVLFSQDHIPHSNRVCFEDEWKYTNGLKWIHFHYRVDQTNSYEVALHCSNSVPFVTGKMFHRILSCAALERSATLTRSFSTDKWLKFTKNGSLAN